MDIRIEWRSLAVLPLFALAFSLFSANAVASASETTLPSQKEQPVETPAATPKTDTTITLTPPVSQEDKISTNPAPDGWEKLAENHIEAVYIKPPQHGIDPNITGIEVRVVAQTKELFDYAEGIAMADCDIHEVFPVSGDIYDVHGNTIDPMHIPLLKGMVYIRAFPQEAYDGLANRLCAGEPSPKAR